MVFEDCWTLWTEIYFSKCTCGVLKADFWTGFLLFCGILLKVDTFCAKNNYKSKLLKNVLQMVMLHNYDQKYYPDYFVNVEISVNLTSGAKGFILVEH